MKILVVCQYYYPENFQITPICEQLVKDGYNISVLTGLPNYPTGIVPEEYRKGKRNENINGVHVIRCFEMGRKKGAIHLALNYLSFYFSSMRAVKKLSNDFDLVFVYQLSPVLMSLPGRWYARKFGKPILLYCCDIWPESMKIYIKNEKNVFFQWIKKISKQIYDSCDRIMVQSKSFIGYLNKTHGIPMDRMIYIPAFADESYLNIDFTPVENGIFDLVFLGNIGVAQDLKAVLQALLLINTDIPFRFHIVGDGVCLEDLRKQVQENGLADCVIFHGRQPVSEMPRYYKLADACLVSLNNDNDIGLTLPTKVQGYMSAGKPIIGMINGSVQEIINESGCGLCVPSGDIDGLAKAICSFAGHLEYYKDCGKNGRTYFINNFNKKRFMTSLEKELKILGRID